MVTKVSIRNNFFSYKQMVRKYGLWAECAELNEYWGKGH